MVKLNLMPTSILLLKVKLLLTDILYTTEEGNTFFTRTSIKGPWQEMADACKKIDPGRVTIASICSEVKWKQSGLVYLVKIGG